MNTKIPGLIVALALAGSLAACDEPEEVATEPVSKPVKTVIVGGAPTGGVRAFPARILASKRVELAFRVSGTLQDLPVREGDIVEEGQTIAELDPKDFQVVVDERSATFEEASNNYQRAKRLVDRGFLSRADFDNVEAKFRTSRAALEQAQTNLSYTVLKSPFKGSVSQRMVQNFEEIQAKEAIIALSDTSSLDVKFDVPEGLMILLVEGETGAELPDPDVFARFEASPGDRFKMTFKEAATRADPNTQTFEVTYSMAAPEGLQVLPGMTATVETDLSELLAEASAHLVPSGAVVGGADLDAKVWVVDPDTMTVASREVKVGAMRDGEVEITEGLSDGERVVTAGAPYLADGMKVWFLPQTEQAEERSEDRAIRDAASAPDEKKEE